MFYHVRHMAHPLTSFGRKWKLPIASGFLEPVRPHPIINQDMQRQSEYLEQVLTHGNTIARVKRTVVGPFVTQFWIELKTKGGKGLARPEEYFHRKWRASYSHLVEEVLQLPSSFRMVPPTEYQPELLLEFINNDCERDVRIREVIESEAFQKSTFPLTIPLGLDVEGNPAVADLAAMPHLLITGMTGTGKSVFLMGMILGLTFKHTPDDLRFVVLAGMPELVYFRNLPHLLGPLHYFEEYGMEVMNILKWLEDERDQRLSLMKTAGFADFQEYNLLLSVKDKNTLPRIVVILDHYFVFRFKDLQTTIPTLKEVDPIFIRLVQTAHPAGIHFVITNQTPSHTDMSITLKESFQARIGLSQNHPDNSVRAIGMKGAEQLAFQGDMLFRKNQDSPLERYQACNINGDEAERVVKFWNEQV